ncbi:phosphohydrolase [Sporosarcina sp. NCCP-2716]|uniref:bis(5'-nucleosyl)-tetraphosphatase (symmetrical) YqeK n=1 Tax=Sporosarcina sp. NCCP-2716 TaxID=2943679 RepID=UPI002041BF77|nr:bis(5'-nucleosyl)-tetraphosphatase (symmetrical) YqeK [Sporosarcina sp. NCCP-2716]GKV68019.1 phosphohydrolase [Sporosarcina sp. NCCP-2716]
MDLDNLISDLQQRLPLRRFEHVLRVTETARALAAMHGVPADKAETAALFHDIAKSMSADGLQRLLTDRGTGPELFKFNKELWHAPAGALIAEEEYGITDRDILNAIRFHTTGRAAMSDLEMVVYVADMIEPGREFPGVEELRRHAEGPLSGVMEACIVHSVQHLVSKRVPVHPDSIECYNYFVQ